MKKTRRLVKPLLLLALCLVPVGILLACAIPVFRYALERWEPYAYEGILFHKDPLDPALTNAIQNLEQGHANLGIWKVNVSEPMQDELKVVWEQEKGRAALPWLVVRYPYPSWQTLKTNLLWAGAFDKNTLDPIVDSPARKKTAQEILKGASAVWIFIEGGNPKENDERFKVLSDHLAMIAKEVKLPEESFEEAKTLPMAGIVPLKVDFAVIRVPRSDPKEKFFLDMLLKTEKDSEKHVDKPMAFPIFGQGRVIWPLIGEGINNDMIEQACAFVLGFCSCEIKDMNPGFDLLIDANWHGAVTNLYSVSDQAPTLVGAGAAIENQEAASAHKINPTPAESPTPDTSPTASVYRGLGLAFVGLVVVVGLISMAIIRRPK